MGAEAIAEKLIETVAVEGNIAGGMNSSVDGAADAIKPVAIKGKNLSIDFFLRFWEGEALSHFRSGAWEDVVCACTKVLDIPGQSETNYYVLFHMGYACMRLEDYLSAREHFALAHRIDPRRAALRLAMHDLTKKIRTMHLRKRRRVDASTEQRRVAMKTYCLPR